MQRDNKNYLEILRDSLIKKVSILDKISEQNEIQLKLAKQETFDYDRFGQTLDEKDQLIAELNRLDDGFQSVYDRIKEVLTSEPERYREEIRQMQTLISKITEKSMDVMAEEKRNRDVIMNRKDNLKKEIGMARASNKVAAGYYKTMSKINVMDSQFIDAKK